MLKESKLMQHQPLHHRWPHRLAVLLVCVVFPLIWVGGLVTTYDAGMAVPDWPTTYGYNLLLYPWQTWVFGPWDLFIEHGHRLLGAFTGLLTIGVAMALWRYDGRRWLCWLGVAAIVLVLLQGGLGGMRVIYNDTRLAMLHGCVAPAFFALCVCIAAFTSRWWKSTDCVTPLQVGARREASSIQRLASLTTLIAFLQIVLGAQLRHLPVDAPLAAFRTVVMAHLLIAGVMAVHGILLLHKIKILRIGDNASPLRCSVLLLCMLIVSQWLLGAGTWVLKYSWPAWIVETNWTASFVIRAEGWLQAVTVTAHVANGSLILGTTVWLTLRAFRLLPAVEDPCWQNSTFSREVLT